MCYDDFDFDDYDDYDDMGDMDDMDDDFSDDTFEEEFLPELDKLEIDTESNEFASELDIYEVMILGGMIVGQAYEETLDQKQRERLENSSDEKGDEE